MTPMQRLHIFTGHALHLKIINNNKHDFGTQKYEGVGGHLVAIAVEKSLDMKAWGYEGVV